MRILARFAVVVVACAFAACGFRLREEIALPAGFERVTLDVADPFSPLVRDLEAALERAGAMVVPQGADDVGAVRIPVNQMTTEVLTVGGAARVQEYTVRYRVEVEVVDAAGKVLLPRMPVVLEREYSFDQTQALGAASEEALIRKELQREMVQQVLRRIEAAGR